MKQSSAPRSSITTSFFPAILDRNPKSVFPKTMMMLSSSAIVASIIDTSTAALSFHFDSFFQELRGTKCGESCLSEIFVPPLGKPNFWYIFFW
ncbi:hypothetical protein HanRHA438_Chr17g0820221 [Helianthus annuus]|nr:hypothetical protein HanPSC8_Chr17g0777501 [Helianthus annuus]KAJ0826956.1 hypothetical protein HanRHA438_Chr17g0820221 [Helianthus annuus]